MGKPAPVTEGQAARIQKRRHLHMCRNGWFWAQGSLALYNYNASLVQPATYQRPLCWQAPLATALHAYPTARHQCLDQVSQFYLPLSIMNPPNLHAAALFIHIVLALFLMAELGLAAAAGRHILPHSTAQIINTALNVVHNHTVGRFFTPYYLLLLSSIWSLFVTICAAVSTRVSLHAYQPQAILALSILSSVIWILGSLVTGLDLPTDCQSKVYCHILQTAAAFSLVIGVLFMTLSFLQRRLIKSGAHATAPLGND